MISPDLFARPERLHFVGFRGDEYMSAVRVWGRPDFIHERATWSVMGDIPGGDKVILGPHAFVVPKKWRAAHDSV